MQLQIASQPELMIKVPGQINSWPKIFGRRTLMLISKAFEFQQRSNPLHSSSQITLNSNRHNIIIQARKGSFFLIKNNYPWESKSQDCVRTISSSEVAWLKTCRRSKEGRRRIYAAQTPQPKMLVRVFCHSKATMIQFLNTFKLKCRCWLRSKCKSCSGWTSIASTRQGVECCSRWSKTETTRECHSPHKEGPFFIVLSTLCFL